MHHLIHFKNLNKIEKRKQILRKQITYMEKWQWQKLKLFLQWQKLKSFSKITFKKIFYKPVKGQAVPYKCSFKF